MRRWVGLLFALVLVTAGCSSGPNEYSENGVTFEYPGDWGTVTGASFSAETGNELWSAAVGSSTVDLVSLTAYQLNVDVADIDPAALRSEVDVVLTSIASEGGGSVEGPLVDTTVGGIPGYQVDISAVNPEGVSVQSRLVLVFQGDVEYFFNCQYTPEEREDILAGCTDILTSFAVD